MIGQFCDEETKNIDSLTTAATQSKINYQLSPNQRDDCKAETKMTLDAYFLSKTIYLS